MHRFKTKLVKPDGGVVEQDGQISPLTHASILTIDGAEYGVADIQHERLGDGPVPAAHHFHLDTVGVTTVVLRHLRPQERDARKPKPAPPPPERAYSIRQLPAANPQITCPRTGVLLTADHDGRAYAVFVVETGGVCGTFLSRAAAKVEATDLWAALELLYGFAADKVRYPDQLEEWIKSNEGIAAAELSEPYCGGIDDVGDDSEDDGGAASAGVAA